MQEEDTQQERDERPVDDKVDLFDPWGEAFLKDLKRNDREFEF